MTHALRQLVLKVHSRCDLACDHCYLYEHRDTSWISLPKVISEETADLVARRFAEYASRRELDQALIVLHGGEPLLAGVGRLRAVCEALTSHLAPVTSLDLRIHTNGVQLGRSHLRLFDEFGVKVGISLDGDRAANDRHRLDRKGRSSYDRVLRAVELLREPEFRHLYLGLLCTVDIANDPIAVHEALVALEPPAIDYLLPHATWDHPPQRPGAGTPSDAPYADWLLAVFDRWDRQGRTVPVRFFDSVLSTLAGGPSLTESLGLAPTDLAVVETDGSFEQADSLKTAYDGAAATGHHVRTHTFDELAGHPGVLARQSGLAGLAEECRRCPVVTSCGGGLYAHRYRTGHGFINPSVYCADLKAFIDGVAARVTRWEPSPVVRDAARLDAEQTLLSRTLLAGLECDPPVAEAVALLDSAHRDTLDELLRHPYVRTALLHAAGGAPDAARLAATVLAAALKARAEVHVSWRGGQDALHLPALGTLSLAPPGQNGPPGPARATAPTRRWEAWTRRDGRTVELWDEAANGKSVVVLGETPGRWRPLAVLEGGTLLDDADPYRHCFPAPGTDPLDARARGAFARLWREARAVVEDRTPGGTARITVVTPLEPGAGVRLGGHGEGAIGAGVDTGPEELALGMVLASRAARLRAVRECADLELAGSPERDLIDQADRWTAEATFHGAAHGAVPEATRGADTARDRARAALDALDPGRLTPAGQEAVELLRAELRGARHD